MEKLKDNAIGGYFGLELNAGQHYHEDAIKLNTARNCFEYILRSRKYSHVYLPYFTCNVLLEPLEKLNIKYSFYDVDNNLEPIFDYSILKDDECFLVTNYFGVKSEFIKKVAEEVKNVIVDNAQAFFEKPIEKIDTFYSPRKFVGVADGGYLSTSLQTNLEISQDLSFARMSHLLKRLDIGAEESYEDFRINDSSLEKQEIKKMSHLTESILANTNYHEISTIRRRNFQYLHQHLNKSNKLNIEVNSLTVPMVYPYKIENAQEVKNVLLENKIFCATYWPNVLQWCTPSQNSYHLSKEIIALPIDQRYSEVEMQKILQNV